VASRCNPSAALIPTVFVSSEEETATASASASAQPWNRQHQITIDWSPDPSSAFAHHIGIPRPTKAAVPVPCGKRVMNTFVLS
jgi:hypothetical protein